MAPDFPHTFSPAAELCREFDRSSDAPLPGKPARILCFQSRHETRIACIRVTLRVRLTGTSMYRSRFSGACAPALLVGEDRAGAAARLSGSVRPAFGFPKRDGFGKDCCFRNPPLPNTFSKREGLHSPQALLCLAQMPELFAHTDNVHWFARVAQGLDNTLRLHLKNNRMTVRKKK